MHDVERMKRLAELARDGIPGDVDTAHDEAERDRFVAAVTRGALIPRAGGAPSDFRDALAALLSSWPRWPSWLSWPRWLHRPGPRWALGFAAAAAIALFALWPARHLGYAVELVPVADGGAPHPPPQGESGYIAAPPGNTARIRFTDDSAVALAPGGSLRVTDVTAAGARLSLEDGRASLHITPRPKARWAVEAGPFTVQVTGTVFDVAWTRSDGTLRVDLHEGSVVVRGPVAPDGLPLRAGQRLIARLHEGDVQIGSADAAGASAASATAAPRAAGAAAPPAGSAGGAAAQAAETAVAADGPADAAVRGSDTEQEGPPVGGTSASPRSGPADGPAAAAAPQSWSRRVAAGDFQQVLAEAEQRGIDGVLTRAALDDLVALADAARYAKRGDLAQRALSATRKRFASTSHGKAAAFLLGRAIDSGGSPGAAIAWYDAYLAESPGGPFAAEALGRKMVAVERTAGSAAAKPLAERYLERYPNGAHATLARDLVKP